MTRTSRFTHCVMAPCIQQTGEWLMSGTTWIGQRVVGTWRMDHSLAIECVPGIDVPLRSIPMARTSAPARQEWLIKQMPPAIPRSFARRAAPRPVMLLLLAFLLTSLSSVACADDGSGQPIKQINGPKDPNNAPVIVQGYTFDRDSHYGHGALLVTSSGGNRHATALSPVHVFASTNRSPALDNDPSGCQNKRGEPIQVSSGTKLETFPIFALPGEMGLKYVLYYNTAAHPSHWTSNFGYSLDTSCEDQIDNTTGRCTHTTAYRPDGSTLKFSGGPDASVYQETFENGQSVTNAVATLSRDPNTGNYTLQDEDALTEVYSSAGGLLSIKDASGIGWTIAASSSSMIVTHTNGQSITVTGGPVTQTQQNGQNVIGQVVTVTDPSGQTYTFDYGDAYAPNAEISDVASITFPGTPPTAISFKYNSYATPPYANQLVESDYNGVPYAYTTYVTASASPYYEWANSTSLADGSETVAIAYGASSAGNLAATISNPLGHVSVNTYDGTNGTGGAYNAQLSSVSNDAVADCGATVATRAYDVNGNLSKTVDNNGNVHTYNYAANGQLQTETEAYGTPQARTTDYVWDPNLRLNRLQSVTVEGWSKTTYTYNAQNRLASIAVTNLSGNGVANQTLTTSYGYTLYANGMVHTMTVTHPSLNNSDTDTSTYDALGNLTSLANGLGQTTNYSNYNGLGELGHVVGPNGDVTDYTYDARGRVATKTIHPNGSAATWTYGYDGFGLLASVSAPDGQVTTWNRDPEMRVTSITHNDKDGTSTETFGYDANNDVTSDVVSRGGVVSSSVAVQYDTLARPYRKQGNHGQVLTYGYDGNGNVLSMSDAAGHVTSYQYDALDRVTQKTESGGASPAIPSAAPSLSAPSTSSGSYTVSWSGVSGATGYFLQEQTNGGGWITIQNSSATSLALSSKPSATFGYRVQGCNATGCGPWSNVGSVIVTHVTGTIDGVAIDGSGNAGITGWACSTGLAQSISVDLYLGGPNGSGTYIGRYSADQSSEPAVASACAVSSGSYRYDIPLSTTTRTQYVNQPIYVYGISPVGAGNLSLANGGTYHVPVNEPAGAPSLNVPASSDVSHYTVSWSIVSGATSYTLQEQVNGGSWATVQNSAATSWGATSKSNGSYGYRVQACNSSGCGAWSVTATITVAIPPVPASAPALSVPSVSYTGSYAVSWGGVSAATSYTLQEQVNGGGWTTVQASGATNWNTSGRGAATYGYRVQACNVSGCGPWSGTGAVNVRAPASAPGLSVPSTNANGSYTVSWNGVTGATGYLLQEQVNGGGWGTVQNNASTSWGASGKVNGSYGYRVQACDPVGCGPLSGVASVTVTIPVPIAINGQSYSVNYAIPMGTTASVSIGFGITGGNTWKVFTTKPGVGNSGVVVASGAVPATATTVQYTWIQVGPPSGYTGSGGGVTNPAASPVAVSSNPSSQYTSGTYSARVDLVGMTYQLRVDFFNAAGANVSSSTCTLTATLAGTY